MINIIKKNRQNTIRHNGERRVRTVTAKWKTDIVDYIEVIIAEDAAEDDAVATEDVEITEE